MTGRRPPGRPAWAPPATAGCARPRRWPGTWGRARRTRCPGTRRSSGRGRCHDLHGVLRQPQGLQRPLQEPGDGRSPSAPRPSDDIVMPSCTPAIWCARSPTAARARRARRLPGTARASSRPRRAATRRTRRRRRPVGEHQREGGAERQALISTLRGFARFARFARPAVSRAGDRPVRSAAVLQRPILPAAHPPGGGWTTTPATRRRSISSTSNRQPCQTTSSPTSGIRSSSASRNPANVS